MLNKNLIIIHLIWAFVACCLLVTLGTAVDNMKTKTVVEKIHCKDARGASLGLTGVDAIRVFEFCKSGLKLEREK